MIDKSTGKEKRKKSFLLRSSFAGYIVKSDEKICVTRIWTMGRLTMRNRDKTILSMVND